jgi:signal transduction histidine kinase
MFTRNWSIRAKIISLLLVPLTSLVVMWGLATGVTLAPGLNLLDAQTDLDKIAHPGQALVSEIQAERKASLVYLANRDAGADKLRVQRLRTDEKAAAFRQSADGDAARKSAEPATRALVQTMLAHIDALSNLRGQVDRGAISRGDAMASYGIIVTDGYQLFASLIRLGTDNTLSRESLAIVGLSGSREVLAQEDAVLSAALAGGPLTAGDVIQINQLIGAERYSFGQSIPTLHTDDRNDYAALAGGPDFIKLRQMEDTFAASAVSGKTAPITADDWQTAYDRVAPALQQLEITAADRLVRRSQPIGLTIFGRIAVTGLLGLVAVIITIIATVRMARGLMRRLAGLRQAALELSIDRLPRVVARLRQGEVVDVAAESPPLPYGGDEIGQVGHAFNELQRTAVKSAIDEATVRQGLNEVFLNIARRSQTLLHRQLSILDRMERRADDPTELEDLFRVDHLATRMRRHAEDLVILAGSAPGRGWRNPVPVVDVLRGAVSEVEDYARVSIRPMPEIALIGRSVGDIIHLLAELIENATSFSPPHTRVNIGGELVSHGFAIEIEDRGLGISADALAQINARLTTPPEFDPSKSAQLGLFVVARLAARHGVKVQLRSSPYGGITAVALLPADLVVAQSAGTPVAALPAGESDSPNGTSGFRDFEEFTNRTQQMPTRPAIELSPFGEVTSGTSRSLGRAIVTGEAVIAPPPRHARREIIEPGDNDDGLPRRIRQTNLAPQLRDDSTLSSGPSTGEIATAAPPSRTPEEMRAMMTSFQSGLIRGRHDAEASANEFDSDQSTTQTREGSK